MLFGTEAFNYCINNLEFNSVLDIGCGSGEHSEAFKAAGKQVTSIDIVPTYKDAKAVNIMLYSTDEKFDLIWCSHILEHQLNVNSFVKKCRSLASKYICVTVPPLKHEIVGGHVTLWNAGLVMYNLVLGGFDCSNAKIKQYGYNISVVAEASSFLLPNLHYDNGDIELISDKLPTGYNYQGFDGNIYELNWDK